MLKNWKSSAYGVAMLTAVVIGQFWPDYLLFCQKLIDTMIAVGFIAVLKDHDVTGGTR